MEFLKTAFRTVKNAWMTFAHGMGWINSRILLTVLYIVVIGPYAIITAIASRLRRSAHPPVTYWIPRVSEEPTLETLRRLF